MFRLRLLHGPHAGPYLDKTFPAYAGRLLRCAPAGPVWALGARDGADRPCGLALAARTGPGEVELLSLLVDGAMRRRGLGRALLRRLEAALQEGGAVRAHTTWSEGLAGAPAFGGLLAAEGWSPPERHQLLLHLDWRTPQARGQLEGRYAKYREAPCLPRGYGHKRWAAMTPAEEAFIRERKGRPEWYMDLNDPFREREAIEPVNSLLLLHQGEPAGWVVNHRTAPDTIRYTDLFVRRDLEKNGVGIALGTHSYWLQFDSGIPFMTMALRHGDARHVRLMERRMGPAGARLRWSLASAKIL
ncbi:MAG: GNAT family N-acetyltransferase [Desulfovibrionaceae bacterium]